MWQGLVAHLADQAPLLLLVAAVLFYVKSAVWIFHEDVSFFCRGIGFIVKA